RPLRKGPLRVQGSPGRANRQELRGDRGASRRSAATVRPDRADRFAVPRRIALRRIPGKKVTPPEYSERRVRVGPANCAKGAVRLRVYEQTPCPDSPAPGYFRFCSKKSRIARFRKSSDSAPRNPCFSRGWICSAYG